MLRIGDWIRFYTLVPLAGALLAGENAGRMPVILIIYFFLIGYAFVVNNYFDVEIDRLHSRKMGQRKNPMANGGASERGVIVLIFLLVGLALLLSVETSLAGTALVVLNLLLFTAYSASPIRLKERVGLDVLTHGLMFGFLPLLA
ncbi:MAG: UbiA family prenyltransferase [Methanosarcinales archaeon]|nr:UbiA family prenyltransferase [Methanosarcinales archaeon]